MKTTLRNRFSGTVSSVKEGEIMAEIVVKTLTGAEVAAVVTRESVKALELEMGKPASAAVKSTFVVLLKDAEAVKTSLRNRFKGTVAHVREGKIASEVVVRTPAGDEICALVTKGAAGALDIKPGDEVWAMFKAFSVVLFTD